MKNFILLSWNNFPWSNLCPLLIALPLHILVKTHFLNSPFRYGVPALNPTVSLLSRLFEQAQLIQPWCRWPSAWSSPFFFHAMTCILYWHTYCVVYASVLKLTYMWKARSVKVFATEQFTTWSTSFFFKELLKFSQVFAFRSLNFGNGYVVLDALLEK